MSASTPPSGPTERSFVARPGRAARQDGWMRWLPGLVTARRYEIAWLRHDLARLGFVTELLSKPIRYEYMNGIALTVVDPVKDKLERYGLFSSLGERRFFATLGEAVSDYVKTHEIDWMDWEDRERSLHEPPNRSNSRA